MTSIFIFRKDYRLQDNNGLIECCKNSKVVYPVFIFTPEQIDDKANKYKSQNAVKFLVESLKELESTISKKGGKLNVFYGTNESIIKKLLKDWKIDSVYVNNDYTPYSKKRDSSIAKLCATMNVKFVGVEDVCLTPMGTIVSSSSGSYYKKFSPFYARILEAPIPTPRRFTDKSKLANTKHKDAINSLERFYNTTDALPEKGGRTLGLKKLSNLVKTHKEYDDKRAFLYYDTTRLSPYIKFGTISIREVYHTIRKHFGKNSGLLRQVIWRDFFHEIVFHNSAEKFRNGYGNKTVDWVNSPKHFKAWTEGKTGYPVVDACMTELNTTGYMHNRGRMIVANFLTRILGINWKLGEHYFATKLYDYDPIHNNLGWQGQAFVMGNEARPAYQSVLNPWLQSGKYDPDGIYIKKWLPVLKEVVPRHLHSWDRFHKDYPTIDYVGPIVDYKENKQKMLDLF